MVARRRFLENLQAVREASSHRVLLNQPLLQQFAVDNRRAQLLRRGLVVVAFATLEEFIRERVAEALSALSLTSLRFENLPEALRIATTLGVFRATQVQASLAKGRSEPYLNLVQDAAVAVGSTISGSLSLHRYAFLHGQSNISSAEIKETLAAFNLKDPWGQITSIADRAGIGALPLESAYLNAHRLRNQAAHVPATGVEPSDLSAFLRQAIGIALGFDAVLSRATRLLRFGNMSFANGGKVVLVTQIALRFLDETARGYREHIPGRRAVKVSPTRSVGESEAITRAHRKYEVLVLRDKSQTPYDWQCTDLL